MAGAPRYGAPGDVSRNLSAILDLVNEARVSGAQALVLPELALSSAACGDLFRHRLLTDACAGALADVARACGDTACVLGLPLRTGMGVHNAAALIRGGEVAAFIIKQNLSPRERSFFCGEVPDSAEWRGRSVACHAQATMRVQGDMELTAAFWDDICARPALDGRAAVLAPAAFPTLAGGTERLLERVGSLTAKGAVLALANAGANESTTDEVFGGEAVISRGGAILSHADSFSGKAAFAFAVPPGETPVPAPARQPAAMPPDPAEPYMPPEGPARVRWCRDCVEIPARALAVRMERVGARAATIGVSGGLDSAMALLVIRRAFALLGLPAEQIIACSLPGLGTGERTRGNARRLMEAVGLQPREIDIRASVLAHFRDIGHPPGLMDTAFENAQARERTQVLMDLANMHGGLMVGTCDLSEDALGFSTFGGDHLSMYCVNCGLYKSAIRHAVRQAAQDAGEGALRGALLDILETPVSPELLPGAPGTLAQETENIVGPYLLNDFFAHHFLTSAATPAEMLGLARSAFGETYGRTEIVERMRAFFTRFFASQFKRNCLSDGPQVLGVSLSPRGGLAMPSDASAAVWLDALDRL